MAKYSPFLRFGCPSRASSLHRAAQPSFVFSSAYRFILYCCASTCITVHHRSYCAYSLSGALLDVLRRF